VGWPATTKVTGGFADSPKHVVDAEVNACAAGRFTDLFIARLNTDGLWLLTRRGGGSAADAGSALALDTTAPAFFRGRVWLQP
jgi:hypothetical protein